MRNSVTLILLILALLQAAPSSLSFKTELFGYIDNLEYYSDYREGVLLLGTDANLFFEYIPHPSVEFSLGVHLKKDFGDEDYYSDARPYFRTQYNKGGYQLNIGVLDHLTRHSLPDAILAEETTYSDGIEEGIQFLWDYDHIFVDFWMSVEKLNTPEHREHLDFGLYIENSWRKLTTSGMVYWDHYGGQLYAPENDPVRDNTVGSVNLKFTQPLKSGKGNIGSDFRFLGSQTKDLGTGYGFVLAPWFKLNEFRTTFSIYKGFDYHTWRGNTIYHTNDIYYYFQLDRSVEIVKNLYFDWGVRIDFVDITPERYFDHFEHKLWISFRNCLDIPIFNRE